MEMGRAVVRLTRKRRRREADRDGRRILVLRGFCLAFFFFLLLFLSLIVFLLRLVTVELSCRYFVESLDYLRRLLR